MLRTFIIFLLTTTVAAAGVSIDIWNTSGPRTSSDQFDTFGDNAVLSADNSGSTFGSGVEKAEAITESDARDFITTPDFTSWRTVANPSGEFGNENGNLLWQYIDIVGDGSTQFSLDSVSWSLDSNDSNDWFDSSGSFSGYSDHLNGIDWGADGSPGGGDDTVYESGNASTSVDRITGLTIGSGLTPPDSGGTEQERIDTIVDSVNSESTFEITASYEVLEDVTFVPNNGSTDITVNSVPEPASTAAIVAVIVALFLVLYRPVRH